jgi:hypothetical protein
MGFLDQPSADPWDARVEQVGRVADRLRSLGVERLGQHDDTGTTIADDVHHWCEVLVAERSRGAATPVPEVPRLADTASGDQWAVIANEYIAAVRVRSDAAAVDAPSGRTGADEVQADEAGTDHTRAEDLIDSALRALRRRL